jgi:hypothetical protein
LLALPTGSGVIPYTPRNSYLRADIGEYHTNITPPAPRSAAANRLYSTGTHILTLEIRTDGVAGGGPYVATDTLVVVGENVDASWWQWDGSRSRSAAWKEPYEVAGECINKSIFSAMDFKVDLVETDDNKNSITRETVTAQVAISQSSPTLTFTRIAQDWGWLVAGVWLPRDHYFTALHIQHG